MGFAGQLFAARVAIGLAVPSPTAMTKAGGAIAKGIADIYKQAELAKNRGGLQSSYKVKLDNLNRTSTTAAEKMNNEIAVRLERNLERLNNSTGRSIGRSFDAVKGHYGKLKKVLSKPMKDQLFGGMSGKGGMGAAQKIASNMQRMSQAGRTETIRQQNTIVRGVEKELELERQIHRKMKQESVTEIEAAKRQKEKVTKLHEELKIQQQIEGQFTQIDNEIKGINTNYEGLNQEADEFANKVVATGDSIKNKFNEALRTSVSLLTVVGYKLNQSAQELIEFERELLNANSVFNLTNDELFNVANTVTEFGNKFGIATQNGAEGLYQLASAGLDADEAMKVLPETLKLSMAVQGDHNTISKLTAQTLFGFGMEMDQAAEVTDKFAFAIQKSLIEYQDLSSAVKFALPFFTSTGQSIDQLLGALQILTNRALEAGIAGRGLRQALAEFAESAMDAEVGFRKMGVEILNSQGEMLQLSEIAAQFAEAVGPTTISNTELLTTLIQDLNVRGATAFIHLVQASDEFTQAVEDTANAGGQLDEMVKIQNESLSAQIQILKTNVLSIFAFRDAAYEGTEFMNGFHEAVVSMVTGFRGLIIEGEGADQQLTEFGMNLQSMAVKAVIAFGKLAEAAVGAVQAIADNEEMLMSLFNIMVKFMSTIANAVKWAAETGVPGLNMSLLELYATLKLISMLGVFSLLGKIWKYAKHVPAVGRGLMGLSTAAGASAATNRAGVGLMNMGLSGGQGSALRLTGGGLASGAVKWGSRAALAGTGIGTALIGYEALKYIHGTGKVKGFGGKANGGYMERGVGGPVMVGEQGPELFMPGQSGQVLNNAQTNNIMGSGVTFRNVTIGIDSFGGIA